MQVDARHGHQPTHLLRADRRLRQRAVDRSDLRVEEVDLAQTALDGVALVEGELEALEKAAALPAGQVVDGRTVEQVPLQRGPDLVLRPAALAHQLGPASHPAPQRPRSLVGAPHLGHIARRQQLGEPAGVEPVGLCLGLGDLPQLLRVHDHDPRHVRTEDPGDRLGAAGGLQPHLVVSTEALGEQLELAPAGPHPAGRAHPALLQDRHLAELAVDVQPDVSHGDLLLPIDDAGDQVGKRHRRIRALSTSGPVAGAATEKHGLAAHRANGLPILRSPREPLVPEPPTLRPRPDGPARALKRKFHGRRSGRFDAQVALAVPSQCGASRSVSR